MMCQELRKKCQELRQKLPVVIAAYIVIRSVEKQSRELGLPDLITWALLGTGICCILRGLSESTKGDRLECWKE